VLAAVCLLIALGRHSVFYGWAITLLPPLRILRYPVKASILIGLAWAILAGLGLDAWRGAALDRRQRLVAILPLAAVTLLAGAATAIVHLEPDRVLKLAAGTSSPTVLPFNDLDIPSDVEVDAAGNVYVTDLGTNRVSKLAAGASSSTVLPFNDLDNPSDVAVDTAASVYILDGGHFRVLKLPAQ